MMGSMQEADLSLSLSLNLTHINIHKHHQQQQHPIPYSNQNHVQTKNGNLFPSFFNSALHHRASWNPFSSAAGVDQTTVMRSDEIRTGVDQTTVMRSDEIRTFTNKGIDVNRLPTSEDYNEDAGASSPNSTISSLSGKRSERDDLNHHINTNDADHLDRAAYSGSDDEDGDNSRKKLRLSKDQSAVLEDTFKDHSTLNPKQKVALAKQLGLRPRQVEVWFQNRRARTKLKQTEVDCEFLKRCCENLTEENRRLHKEVQELRALKLSPQFYMQMAPPTTLTMCPSCERVGPPTAEGRSRGTLMPRA